jgi:hypothetical protein
MDEQPLILDVGKKKKKDVKALKRGTGPIAAEVQAAVERAVAGSAGSGEVVPVVMLFQEKSKKRRMPMPMPLPMPFPSKIAKAFGLS